MLLLVGPVDSFDISPNRLRQLSLATSLKLQLVNQRLIAALSSGRR